MEWIVASDDLLGADVDALVVAVGENGALSPLAQRVDARLDGGLARLVADVEFKGGANAIKTIYTLGQLPARFLVLAGTGQVSSLDLDGLRRLAGGAARAAIEAGATRLGLAVPADLAPVEAGRAIAEGVLLGSYRYTRYKSKPDGKTLASVHLEAPDEAVEATRQGVGRGEHVAAGVNLARDLVNQPGADLWPDRLAEIAREVASANGLACDVYDEQALAEMGAGALLSVGRGSARPPRLIHLRYRPASAPDAPPIAFIGKGITFDTGGYSIKTAGGMENMKDDMAGAAAVLGAMQAIAQLQPAVAVDAVIASAENMISGQAMRPGDVLTSLSGTTIEVTNTDAEGRLVLADALTFAIRQGATEMIDLATLTGACVVALGTAAVGVMGNQQAIVDRLLAAASAEGERMWQLPLYDEYREALRSEVADLKNSGGRYAGAQIGASFLKDFVGDTPWVHLDIAGPAYLDKVTPLGPKGATGSGVRALVRYAANAAGRRSE